MLCDICSKEFKSKDAKHELNIHKLKVHEGVEPIMCPQCPMAFATKNVLNNHLRGVHTNREFKCDQCEKIFTAKHTLKFHVMTLHSEGPVEFKCSHCPETFKSYTLKSKHSREAHPEHSTKGKLRLTNSGISN